MNGAAKAISPAAGKSRQKTGLPGKWHFAAKRIFDVFWSVFGLTVFSPLMLLAAVLVGTTSPGGILFRQERVGKGGVPFTIYKFRTMRRDNAGLKITAGGDSRVTPVGRVLRKTKLDELPQFWNVLRGDMSFVGPRPSVVDEVNQYEPWQRRRLSMKPGLTCLWQISGRNELTFDEWMRLDLEYIDNWSLWLDVKILAQTVPAVLRGAGAS